MKKYVFIILMISMSCLMVKNTWAEQAYITDAFEITLRTGPTIQNRVIAMPASAEAVEVLETQEEWSLVRLSGRGRPDLEGWVQNRYLISRLPWKLQTESLQNENSRLIQKLGDLENQVGAANTSKQNLAKDLHQTSSALKKLEGDYEKLKQGSADYINLKSQYNEATVSLESTKKTADELTKENDKLKSSQSIRWFATGALVLLGGFVIGLALGQKQKKRKSLYF